MSLNARQSQIIDMLDENRFVAVEELCKRLYASGATIRRDLAELERRALLIRVRGGALAPDNVRADKPFLMREGENRQLKRKICLLAKTLVHDSMTLMMDSSSTVAMLAAELGDVRGLSVVTNGVKTLTALTEHTDAKIFCTGGIIEDSSSMRGQTAVNTISQYRADMAFFSCKGLDSTAMSASESSEENAQIKRRMLDCAGKRVLLCDSSKFERIFFCKICNIEDIDVLVTDARPPESILKLVNSVIY